MMDIKYWKATSTFTNIAANKVLNSRLRYKQVHTGIHIGKTVTSECLYNLNRNNICIGMCWFQYIRHAFKIMYCSCLLRILQNSKKRLFFCFKKNIVGSSFTQNGILSFLNTIIIHRRDNLGLNLTEHLMYVVWNPHNCLPSRKKSNLKHMKHCCITQINKADPNCIA